MTDGKTEPSCIECKFAFMVDFGYSNWTVEGTTFYCGLKKHPDGEFDRFYGKDKRLKYAKQCDSFDSGVSIVIDVERLNLTNGKMTIAQRILWDQVISKVVI